jgi:two-component system, OmpR family, alkaline phosphatase synthesis response regulator PhoP
LCGGCQSDFGAVQRRVNSDNRQPWSKKALRVNLSAMVRVLIVEDDEIMRLGMCTVLEESGHDASEASNIEEGVSEFKTMLDASQAPDLVIVDLLLPKQDSYETIIEIKKESRNTKTIAPWSDVGGEEIILKISKTLGADRTLSQPFSSEELVEAVNLCFA